MSLLTTSQLADLAGITRRQAQRILDRGTPNLGARRTPGGHWEIPDSGAVRKWARNHRRWARNDGGKAINPPGKGGAIVTIQGINQGFQLWKRNVGPAIGRWNKDQLDAAISLLAPQAELHTELCRRRESL